MAIPGALAGTDIRLARVYTRSEDGAGTSGCCAGVRGTIIRTTAAVPIAIGTIRTTGTTTTDFVLLCPRRALFNVRAGGWEFVGSTTEESRPAPVMEATPSEYQPGMGGLVGCRAEESPVPTGVISALDRRGYACCYFLFRRGYRKGVMMYRIRRGNSHRSC
jgi:hypothetical protein